MSKASFKKMPHVPKLHTLPISGSAPIYHLGIDPAASLETFFDNVKSPSLLRDSRRVDDVLALVSALPSSFPYRIEPLPQSIEDLDKYLAGRQPSKDCVALTDDDGHPVGFHAPAWHNDASQYPRSELVSLSSSCIRDLLPQTDFDSDEPTTSATRDILSGKITLGRVDNEKFAPWSQCYGGHQFGSWAGQLGDGRAVSIISTPVQGSVPFWPTDTVEIQLKGAGRTPFSRFGDGLAVLRSSIREYLVSEYMARLNIPTSRALSLISFPDTSVLRETPETAAIVARAAPTWLRIGTFEIVASRRDYKVLEQLVKYSDGILQKAYEDDKVTSSTPACRIVESVAVSTARMIAHWQIYGFMHGVMNSDNFSITGNTIDYGPYAFMDIFDWHHICNHTDIDGRYDYKNQPEMGLYAIARLWDALDLCASAELARESWVDITDVQKKRELITSDAARDFFSHVRSRYWKAFADEKAALAHKRLGISVDNPSDLFDSLLDAMEGAKLDFHHTIRSLSRVDANTDPENFIQSTLVPFCPDASSTDALRNWIADYARTVSNSAVPNRREAMDSVNPRFVLRQWVIEEAISRAQQGDFDYLHTVERLVEDPFQEFSGSDADLCALGDPSLLGFQCSCSS